MKLFYSPAACSMSPHIVAEELGLPFELEKVDLKTHLTAKGDDFYKINPKGYVPALQLDDGSLLTEGPAIVQYLADLKPEAGLVPKAGTMERYRLAEMLNYVSTELHKGFGGLFNAAMPDEYRVVVKEKIAQHLSRMELLLAKQPYLLGTDFGVADAYFFTVIGWGRLVGVDLKPYPNLLAYQERIATRPAVRRAMRDEGLIKSA
jgi:glutathione S-transferase